MEKLPILPSKNVSSNTRNVTGLLSRTLGSGKIGGGGILARALGKQTSKWSDDEEDGDDMQNDGNGPSAVVVLPSVQQQLNQVIYY